jgi:hypothetical protein
MIRWGAYSLLIVALISLFAWFTSSRLVRERFAPVPTNVFAVNSTGLSNSLGDSSTPNTDTDESLLSIQKAQANNVFQIYSKGLASSRQSSDEYVKNVMQKHNMSLEQSIDTFRKIAKNRESISLKMKPPSKAASRINEYNPLLSINPSPNNAQRMLTVDVKSIPLTYDILRGSFRGMPATLLPPPPNPRNLVSS